MSTPRPTIILSFILSLVLFSALSGCGGQSESAVEAPALAVPQSALQAVVAKPGVSRAKLARAIEGMFSDADAGETRAVVVISGGRIVAERYGPGYSADTRLVGWSMSKTITGVLIGQLVSDGRLRMDETPPIPAWQRSGDPRGGITLRQLLQMRSGLRHSEMDEPIYGSDEVRMLFLDGRDNMAAYAEAQPLEAAPGRKWEYSSATTVILSDLAARALTDSTDPEIRRAAVAEYLQTRLFQPLGITSMTAEFDASGTLIGSSLIHATARDWGKFGEFLRNGGAVQGAQVLPRGWIEFMTKPSPRNPGYGAQLWLNRRQADGKVRLLPGRAPASMFAAIGHLGQYVLVSPQQGLTVVRLGNSTDEQREHVRDRLADIVALFPKR